MSEPVAKHRPVGDPRNPFDLSEIERRMRESVEHPSSEPRQQDPLAELARLVGNAGADPFSNVFDDRGGPTMPPPAFRSPSAHLRPPEPPPAGAYDPGQDRASEPYQDYYAHDGQQRDYAPAGYGQQSAEQGYYGYDSYAGEQQSQGGPWIAQGYEQPAYEQYSEEPPRRTGRAKLLIGAAAVVMAAGLAGAYALRSGGSATQDAPTILANPGPTKVQPAEPVQDGPKQSVSVLERGASGNTQSRVVQNEEQPVDLGATARVSGSRPARSNDTGAPVTLAPPPPPPVANSIFAEPKRVKAVAVRPDGTIIDPASPAKAEAASGPTAATTPAPAPAARPNDIASLVAATSTPASSGAKPAPRAETKPVAAAATPPSRPAANATTAPTTTASIPAPTAGGGNFAVQLAGTTSAEEAKDAVERLTRRFSSELGGMRPSVVKAEVGSKTVYRVRVKGLSSDDANTLCARLKAGGGSCFVARD